MASTCDRCRSDLPAFARECPACGDPIPVERPGLRLQLRLETPLPRPAWVGPAVLIGLSVAAGVAVILLL